MKLCVLIAIAASSSTAIAAPTAEALYSQGQRAYDGGDYTTAVLDWEQSYALSHEPALLFNLAQANRLLGDCGHALADYKRFIALDSTSAQRGLADDFVRELEPRCGAPTQGPIPDRSREMPDRTLKLVGIVTGSGGALILVIGAGYGRRASTLGDGVTRACSRICNWAAQKDTDAAGRRDTKIGYVLDAIGLAGIAGGVVMYYLGHHGPSVTVTPRPREGGVAIFWDGSW